VAETLPVLATPARLCWGPTNLSAAYPHGGTDLGEVDAGGIVVQIQSVRVEVVAAELGTAVAESIDGGRVVRVTAGLRRWTTEALRAAGLPVVAGGVSGRPVAREGTATRMAGVRASTLAGVLLVAPVDPTRPAWLLAHAAPVGAELLEVAHAVDVDAVLACAWVSLPHAGGVDWSWGLLRDLSLPVVP
jgi:hypothetical protein